ncbi:MAG: TonB C-terminal domain-containing protein [bacterium]
MQKNKHFRKNYFTYFLRLGLIISGSVHLLTVGTLFGMNVLFFEQPKEDEESNEFEMLEQQSIEINALSADEVRALIAALEGKTSEASEGDSIPAGGEEVSEDLQSDGDEVQEEQTDSIESVETESISEVVEDAVEEQPAPELSVEKDTPPEPEPVPEPEKVVEAPQEPEPVKEITEVIKPEASDELQQKTEEERKKRLQKSVLAEEVEEIEVLSESEEIGSELETLIGEEEPTQIIEELEGQQELLSKPLENLLDEDVDTMKLVELDSTSNQLETGVSSTLEEFSNSEASLSNLTESALKELDNRSLFDAPELETFKVSTNSLDSLNPAESTLEPDTTQSLRESTTRLKQQVKYSEKESSVLDRAKPEREEDSVNDPVEEQTIDAVVESPETRFETNRSLQTQTEENVSMSALKSTQPADEPTKIQTASELVKLERKTLSSEVSASEDAKESSPAPKPTLVQASKPKAKPVQAGVRKTGESSAQGSEGESNVEGTGGGNEIVIANLDLEDLQNLSLEDLKELEKTLPEGGISGNVNLKDVLGKLKFGKIDLKKIRKRGKLSKEKTNNAVEVVSKNAALFAAGKSKIRDKIKPMSLFQYREYLMKVDPILRQKWKIPLEISAKLEVRVKLVLDRKGTILQYAFVDISGNKIFDQSVRDLLNELDQLIPLPEEFEGALTEIGINFKPR